MDWMTPSVIFSAAFFCYAAVCVVEKNAYAIEMIPATVGVI